MEHSEHMEYTLIDALDTLVEKKNEQERTIEDLTNRISNNEVNAVQTSSSMEDVKTRGEMLLQRYLKEVQKLQPRDYAIPRTPDLHAEVFKEMELEIRDMQSIFNKLEQTFLDIQEDIKYLRNKKNGLDKMREAYMGFTETFANSTYKNEQILTKRIFQNVKDDLYAVVDTIFPDNRGFKEFLAILTSAYMKGGDDVYVNVTPQVLDCVNFLLEADIVQYHRNDKTKVRMTELL